ncbi:tRNA U-34 5-methylaminomethyl-2-thiouridine biosynthesis protein [Oligoflexus tunisiensis]|uniref:DODA-type extradiol aromatic ring-opening family dioxygenase n=1 Tax=Oligoflexus tunisiensis TaxID=708132 RepID=UPI000AB95136|nr:tRNA U-34 5-methylaminomethyl-2-thiouridine biosynthesis protein [Oligoflexus tunisiensis]
MKGKVVAGVLAPHPPHLVYAENPPQNEPRAECGWEVLRWAYERCRANIKALKPDALIVHSPHWPTVVGHHFLGLPHFKGLSVDPIFPHLFRYHYDVNVDVDLSLAIKGQCEQAGMSTTLVTNPDFRLDYGSIISLHLINPDWDIPVVFISSNQAAFYFSNEIGNQVAADVGHATRRAVEASGKRCVLLASNSLSHRHFVHEPDIPEDMSFERIHHHGQYLWDMKILEMMRRGQCRELLDIMPEFNEMATAETKAGALTWMLEALQVPTYPAIVHGYGTVIGTGNAVVEWNPSLSQGA